VLDLYEEFKSIIGALNERSIEYALCGGLAMAVHGLVRSTVDIDLLIEQEAIDQVKEAARTLGYTIEANPISLAKGAVQIRRVSKLDSSGDVLSLDLLLVTPQILQAWEGRTVTDWSGIKLSVVSREGLIALKLLRGSAVDVEDIARLRELK
jgi:hypothetical protein